MFQTWDSCLDKDGLATLRCIPIIFKNVISAALLFVGVTALIFIIYAGISMVTSQGDPNRVAAAKKIMTFAIIGLVIVLLSFGTIIFIGYTTGSATCITNFTDVNKFVTGC